MNDARKTKFDFLDSWYGSLDDIKQDFVDNGFDVYDINNEYAVIEDSDENQYYIRFSGTERTITIDKIELLESIIIENKNSLKETVNEDKAKKDFDKLLEPFNGTDIKYIGEDNNTEYGEKAFAVNIIPDNYKDWIENIKNSNEFIYEHATGDYVKETEYGRIVICIDDYISIVVYYDTNLNESKKLTEGGIYPVDLDLDVAKDAFEDKLSSILNGDVTVKNLELMPSFGFGGAGIYWYSCDIVLGDDVVEKLLDKESTTVAYNANENNNLIIYTPNITVVCSHNDDYIPSISFDSRNENDDFKQLKKEEEIIEDKIIEILKNNKNELVELLKDYEIPDEYYDEEFESIIPIEEKMTLDDYQRIIYDGLDNISTLAESYDGAEDDTDFEKLNLTFERIEEEIQFIKDKLLEFK